MTDTRAEPTAAIPSERRRKILIVDDDATTRRLLGLILNHAGFEVWTASDGAEALVTIESSPPDLLLLDLEMPGINGAEVCRQLRAAEREAIRQLPVIMLAGLVSEAEEVACLAAGANDFVTKPVGREVLLARIETQLRLGALSDELRAQNMELAQWRSLQEADLEAAKATQDAIVARTLPRVPGWNVESQYAPLIQVGGDVYGWNRLPGERWLFWVADATGHGVAAALFTTLAAWLFHHAANRADTAARILAEVNSEFWSVFHGRSFMTACCAVLDAEGVLTHAGAGHPPMLVRRRKGGVERVASMGTMLGIIKSMQLSETTVRLAPGDLALLYTDGLFGLRDPQGLRVGHSVVEEILAELPESQSRWLEALRDALLAHTGSEKFDDDVAAIALVRGEPAGK